MTEQDRDFTTHKNVVEQIYKKVSNYTDDVDAVSEMVSELMTNTQVKLTDSEIKQVCDAYYKHGQQTSERLSNADKLFLQLHHTNGMILQ